jgi:hypothetical protein
MKLTELGNVAIKLNIIEPKLLKHQHYTHNKGFNTK